MKPLQNSKKSRVAKTMAFLVGLTTLGCGSSEVGQISSAQAPVQPPVQNTMLGTGSGSTPIPMVGMATSGTSVSSEQQDAARRKQEQDHELEKLRMEQESKATEAAENRRLKSYQSMMDVIPMLAIVTAFTQLTDKSTGNSGCIRGGSTYKSLLADAKSVFQTAEKPISKASEVTPNPVSQSKSAQPIVLSGGGETPGVQNSSDKKLGKSSGTGSADGVLLSGGGNSDSNQITLPPRVLQIPTLDLKDAKKT